MVVVVVTPLAATACIVEVTVLGRNRDHVSTGVVHVVRSPLSWVDTNVLHSDAGMVIQVVYVSQVADSGVIVVVAPLPEQSEVTSI